MNKLTRRQNKRTFTHGNTYLYVFMTEVSKIGI